MVHSGCFSLGTKYKTFEESRQHPFKRIQLVGNARMGDDKAKRVGDALSTLVDALIPSAGNEDESAIEERREDALELAKSIIDGY